MTDAARIRELEEQLVIAVAAIHRAELELLGAAEDILGDGQIFGTPQDVAARFLCVAYPLRCAREAAARERPRGIGRRYYRRH